MEGLLAAPNDSLKWLKAIGLKIFTCRGFNFVMPLADSFDHNTAAHQFYSFFMQVVRHYLTQFGPRFDEMQDKWPAHFTNIEDDPPLTRWFGK